MRETREEKLVTKDYSLSTEELVFDGKGYLLEGQVTTVVFLIETHNHRTGTLLHPSNCLLQSPREKVQPGPGYLVSIVPQDTFLLCNLRAHETTPSFDPVR